MEQQPQPVGRLRRICERLSQAFSLRKNFKTLFVDERAGAGPLDFLDGIRAIAILLVVATHTWWALPWQFATGFDSEYNRLTTSLELRLARNGDLGVDLFFVLSGFLIAHLLWREYISAGQISVINFFRRRLLRIAPVYMLVLAVYWISYAVVNGPDNVCNRYGWTNIIYINNFYPTNFADACMVWTWSIAVEVQFYLVSPFLILLATRWPRVGITTMCCLIAASLCLRGVLISVFELYYGVDTPADYTNIVYNKVYTRVSPYLMGMIVATLYSKPSASPPKHDMLPLRDIAGEDTKSDAVEPIRKKSARSYGWLVFVWCGLVVALAACVVDVFFGHGYDVDMMPELRIVYLTFHGSLLGAGVAFFIYVAVSVKRKHGLVLSKIVAAYRWVMSMRACRIVALLSYSIYLVHLVIIPLHYSFRVIDTMSFWRFLEFFVENTLASVLIAIVLYLLVEKPILNLRL